MDDPKQQVRAQFTQSADSYVTNRIHAKGADLDLMVRLAQPNGNELALDVATGTGHTALAFAPSVRLVFGVDLTQAMIDRARASAAERGVANAVFTLADVDALPFADSIFDLVTCRIAAHHFPDLPAALRQMGRVLKPGGLCLVVDNYVPADEVLDRFINEVERLRDPSHVRAHNLAEWQAAFAAAGLTFDVVQTFPTEIQFTQWVASARTPEAVTAEIRRRLANAPPDVVDHFAVQTGPDLRFSLHKAVMAGRKAQPQVQRQGE